MSGFSDPFVDSSDAELMAAAAGSNPVASLQAGHSFSLLLAGDDTVRHAMLENTLDAVADTSTRFSRATNPLRARLTLERLLLQVVQGPVDLEREAPAALIGRIAARRGDETRVILVIERAETLHPEVLHFFGQTAAVFPDHLPRLQVLFVGQPEFHAMLDNPDAGLDERAQELESNRTPPPEEVAFAAPEYVPVSAPYVPPTPGVLDNFWSAWNKGRASRVGIVGGTAVGVAALAFAVFIATTEGEPIRVTDTRPALDVPDSIETEMDPPVLAPGPAPDPVTARLRSEFENYLIASGRDATTLSPAEKRAAYQDFMVWWSRTGQRR